MSSAQFSVLNEPTVAEWTDWKWQQRHAIRSVQQLMEAFPGLVPAVEEYVQRNLAHRRFQITPYAAGLVHHVPGTGRPDPMDPLWRQFVPYWPEEGAAGFEYDGHTDNWEMPGEMVTPIAQHKYDNRIIVRLANVCLAYCQFCYEALRTLERESSKLSFQQKHWDETVEYVRRTSRVEEVILSGGEPLMHPDERLDRVLSDLDTIGRPIVKRIHTRALTFNPFRITKDLLAILKRRHVTALGLHVTHPNEITPEFLAAVGGLQESVPILFANIPLLKGVNDSAELIHDLGMLLYANGVIPHYLYHFMPHSPGAVEFRTSVQTGIDIIRTLKRRTSNLAVPEFVLPHYTGKFTPPLAGYDESPFTRVVDDSGSPAVRFKNWLGETVNYHDERDVGNSEIAAESARAARVVLSVDVTGVRENVDRIREYAPGARIMAVLKADAYGLGAAAIAKAIEGQVSAFATDNVAEAVELRRTGLRLPILIIDGDVPDNAATALEYELMPGIANYDLLDAFQRAAATASRVHPVWLVANVGFNRSGFREPGQFAAFARRAQACGNLEVRAVYAHLTDSNGDPAVSREQIDEFKRLFEIAKEILGPRLESSLFASHGLLRWGKSFPTDWVRPGLLMFGEHAFKEDVVETETLQAVQRFRPALRMRARITQLLAFDGSEGVGYGRHVRTHAGQRLATVSMGFGTGYPLTTGSAYALVHGQRAPLFGESGMDSLQIDVTELPEAALYEWVTLAGADGDQRMSFSELARRSDCTVYKLLSGLRCRREHLHSERV